MELNSKGSVRNLSILECKAFHKSLLANAEAKWAISENFRKSGDYGDAVSYHLISIEEYIKSIIMLMDSVGYEFRKIEGIDVFYRQHKIRFFIAYIMFAVAIVGDDFIKWIRQASEQPNIIKKQLHNLKSANDGDIPFGLKIYFFKKVFLFKKEIMFFKNADVMRQLGFYMDVANNTNNQSLFSETQYNEIYDRLFKVKKLASIFSTSFDLSAGNMERIISENKQLFKEKNLYKLIEKMLKEAKGKPDKPFDYFIDKFEKMNNRD